MNMTSLFGVLAWFMQRRDGRGFLFARQSGPGSGFTNAIH